MSVELFAIGSSGLALVAVIAMVATGSGAPSVANDKTRRD